MRVLAFLWGCAAANPALNHPATNFDECDAQCQSFIDQCERRCEPMGSSAYGQTSALMAASQCRQGCWQRDDGCRRECGRRFKPK